MINDLLIELKKHFKIKVQAEINDFLVCGISIKDKGYIKQIKISENLIKDWKLDNKDYNFLLVLGYTWLKELMKQIL